MKNINDIPAVNWPADNGDHYMIQLYLSAPSGEKKPFLRFGKIYDSHKAILKKFLSKSDLDIEYDEIDDPSGDPFMPKMPAAERKGVYELCGGGKAEVWVSEKKAKVGRDSRSDSYQKGIDFEHLDLIKPLAAREGWTLEY